MAYTAEPLIQSMEQAKPCFIAKKGANAILVQRCPRPIAQAIHAKTDGNHGRHRDRLGWRRRPLANSPSVNGILLTTFDRHIAPGDQNRDRSSQLATAPTHIS